MKAEALKMDKNLKAISHYISKNIKNFLSLRNRKSCSDLKEKHLMTVYDRRKNFFEGKKSLQKNQDLKGDLIGVKDFRRSKLAERENDIRQKNILIQVGKWFRNLKAAGKEG